MAGDSHWRPAPNVRIGGHSLRAVKPHNGTRLRAVCIAELRPNEYAAVMDATAERPMVDGSGAWAFAADVRKALSD